MPIGPGRYRVVTRGGEKIRLHFTPSGKVDEAKNLKTGATHTPSEFQSDAEKKDQNKRMNARIRGNKA